MIDDEHTFLAHAVRLEENAALAYERLAEQMAARANVSVAGLFRKFAGYSRQHLGEARERAVRTTGSIPGLAADAYHWPNGQSPETPSVADLRRLTVRGALLVALETERQACSFYAAIAGQTQSDTVKELALEFAAEEAEHVEALERWIARLEQR